MHIGRQSTPLRSLKILEKSMSQKSRKLNLNFFFKLYLTRDVKVAEQNFLHRWIELEDLYRQPLPFRKILVPPGG